MLSQNFGDYCNKQLIVPSLSLGILSINKCEYPVRRITYFIIKILNRLRQQLTSAILCFFSSPFIFISKMEDFLYLGSYERIALIDKLKMSESSHRIQTL